MKINFKIQIPIFITARGDSKMAIDRNKELLKYTYVFIRDMNMFNQTFIISDNEEMLEYAKKLGFIYTIHQPCETENDISFLTYTAIYQFHLQTQYKPDWIIVLALNQLFRLPSLISDCIQNIDSKYDVVASYTEISNKSDYFIKDNKIVGNGHLVTHERDRQKMLDGVIYAIKTNFAIYVMQHADHDLSEIFWKGKFKFFENRSAYTDIYTLSDINKFNNVVYTIEEVRKIKI